MTRGLRNDGMVRIAALLLALSVAGCAGAAPQREGSLVEPATTMPIPTATPAPAPTADFPMPAEEEPAPAPAPEPEAAAPPPAPAEPAPAATTAHSAVEDRLFALANEARVAAGVGQLQRLGGLDAVARGWSEHLAGAGLDLAHNPSYSSQIPGGWSSAAENVAWIDDGGRYGTEELAQAIHQGWMGSDGHRANLLNPAFTHLGVGVVHGARGYYLTQNFGAY